MKFGQLLFSEEQRAEQIMVMRESREEGVFPCADHSGRGCGLTSV